MSEKTKPTPPKGGKKGGTMYPRVPLEKAVEFATKLVSKTHTGPQPRSIVGPGVFGTAGTAANERFSALRQFGLLSGTDSEGYEATQFAKDLVAAADEKQEMLKQACLKPALFLKLHQTFLGDTVTKARIRQQVLGLKVHPDLAEECLGATLLSFYFCGLWKDAGNESVTVAGEAETSTADNLPDTATDEDVTAAQAKESSTTPAPQERPPTSREEPSSMQNAASSRQKANLEIKIDPSMDPEKLDRLLGVLRKYGQL